MMPRVLANQQKLTWQRCLIGLTVLVGMWGTCLAWSEEPLTDLGAVELVRDQWGVPYVFSDTDAGAMYGLGYATAEDRGFQMHYSLRIIQGRLAEVVGNAPHVRRRNDTALTSDRKMRTFGFARAAEQRIKELDPESVQLLEAYARGVNDYFAEHRDALPELFAKTGLEPEPWKPADCLLSWWHLAQFFATDGTRDLISYRNLQREAAPQGAGRGRPGVARPGRGAGRGGGRGRFPTPPTDVQRVPSDESTAVVQRDDVSDAWLRKTQQFMRDHGYSDDAEESAAEGEAGPKFSHAWVADGKYSGSGSAVLVSMPQTPVANPSLLYEFHLQGKTFAARGVGVAGSPIILIGWNPDVAWGMTALGADQADLFMLKTDDEHPGQYEFDGQWRDIETLREEIKVKGEAARTINVRMTHLGPIINEFAFAQPGEPLVALKRIPICDTNHDTIQGALAMMRAKDSTQFLAGLDDWRFPTANVLFGDRAGTIGYSTVGALPLRSALAEGSGRAAVPGTGSKYDWQTIIPQDLVPHVLNPNEGYVLSGNHRPIGSFYSIPLGTMTGSMGDTVRSWRLRQLLESKKSMTPQELFAMFHDSTNPARQAIVRVGLHMRDALQADLSAETKLALQHLEPWLKQGASSRLDGHGAALATQINTQFRFINTELAFIYGGGDSGFTHFLKTVTKRLDADPKAPLSSREKEYINRLLADAWKSAVRQYGEDAETWDATALKRVAQRVLPYYGGLDGFPSLDRNFDLHFPALPCVDGATVFSQAAQAYVQCVPLGDIDNALSLLPPGATEAPGNVLRTVNMENWAAGKLHPAPISRAAVLRIAANRKTLVKSSK